jgi:mono/diheme cytochrome c family protein
MRGHGIGWTTALLIWGAAASAAAWEPPASLRETGLYSDWTRRAVAADNLPFSPQYPLWTDGAAKSRFIHLPAGTWIDARDPDAWEFPVGAKLWKEFRFGGRPVETRYIERTADGWQYAAYEWSEDGEEARLAPERGTRSVEIRDGVRHAIPARFDCRICHEGRPTPVLGFTALQLSPDRDPNALHAEPVRPGDLDLAALVARGLVRHLPAGVLAAPPRLPARSAGERAALGYLYGNCAMCHNARGPLASLGLSFDYTLGGGRRDSATLRTTLDRPSDFRVPGAAPGGSQRLHPGDPDQSAVAVRLASRNAVQQMPPLGTQLVDEEAVRLVRQWIADDLGTRHARLAPRKETDR